MHEKILKLAAAIVQPSEEETPLVEMLCAAAEREAAGRLRTGLSPETCMEPFCCAAAMLTAAGLLAWRSCGGEEDFTAGDVRVSRKNADPLAALSTLRRQAAAIMAPYWRDDGFAFAGVRG